MKRIGRRAAAGLAALVLLGVGSASAVAADDPGPNGSVLIVNKGDNNNIAGRDLLVGNNNTVGTGHTITQGSLPLTPAPSATRHVVAFYQTGTTTGDPGQAYVSPAPLAGQADVVEVAAFHLNDPAQYPILTLNSDAPSAAKYAPMWRDVAALQAKGLKATALLGGAAPGTYTRLDQNFGMYYPPIRDALRNYKLDGIDLDVEEPFTEATAERLINQLRTDFGPSFLITLAPSPTAWRTTTAAICRSSTTAPSKTPSAPKSTGTTPSSTATTAASPTPATTTRSSRTTSPHPRSSPPPSPTPTSTAQATSPCPPSRPPCAPSPPSTPRSPAQPAGNTRSPPTSTNPDAPPAPPTGTARYATPSPPTPPEPAAAVEPSPPAGR